MPMTPVNFALATSGTTQDVTGSLGGDTPSAVLILVSGGVTAGTARDTGKWGIGAASATTARWYTAHNSQHGQGTTNTDRVNNNNNVLGGFTDAGAQDFLFDLDSFITNGCRLDVSPDTAGSAWLATAVFFHGSDITNAHASSFTGPTSGGTIDVTAPGFEPDFLILAHTGQGSTGGSGFAYPSIGFAVNDGSDTCRWLGSRTRNAVATTDVCVGIRNDAGMGEMNFSSAAFGYYVSFDTYDSSGFTCRHEGGGDADELIYYLAIETSRDVWVGDFDTPTATGSEDYTSSDFTPNMTAVNEPESMLLGISYHTAMNTATEGGNAGGGLAMAVFDGSTARCFAFNDEHNLATSNTQSLTVNAPINLPQDDGSTGIEASFTSFGTTNKLTLNYGQVNGAATKVIGLAYGAAAVAGRTTKNTDIRPLGVWTGISRMTNIQPG